MGTRLASLSLIIAAVALFSTTIFACLQRGFIRLPGDPIDVSGNCAGAISLAALALGCLSLKTRRGRAAAIIGAILLLYNMVQFVAGYMIRDWPSQ